MATTSGVAGSLQYDAATTIDEAFRRCGKLPSTVSAEQLASARLNLFQALSNYGNRGLGLWTVRDTLVLQRQGRNVYTLPADLVNVLAVQYQRHTALTPSATAGTATTITLDFGASVNPQVLTIVTYTATTWDAVLEYQDSTGTWQNAGRVANGLEAYVVEAEPAQYWRLRETVAAALPVTAIALRTIERETPLSQCNRDDWLAQPIKTTQLPGEAAQFLFRKATPPQMALTYASDATLGGFRVTNQRQVQDVTALSQIIDCPQRWYNAVVARLAVMLLNVLDASEVPPNRDAQLRAALEGAERDAENGETDGAPIRLAVQIRGYTR